MPGAEDQAAIDAKAKADADAKVKADADALAAKNKDEADKLDGLTPEEYKAEIKKLRKENAERRTTAKTLEESLAADRALMGKVKQALGIEKEESPEEIAEGLKAQNAALELELGIHQLAAANQIPADQIEYFGYLFHKGLGGLKEGEELGDEAIAEIAAKVKAINGAGGEKKTTTGIDNKGNPPPGDKGGDVTLEAFIKMNPGEKGFLYQKNPGLYERLMGEAKTKRVL